MTMEELAWLRELCDKATPGPWYAEFYAFHWDIQIKSGYAVPSVLRERCADDDDDMDLGVDPDKAKINATLMAALDPATALRLLAAAERSCKRPIATAPRDGTEVIIHDGFDRFQNATFASGFWYSKVTGEIIHDPIGWLPIPGEGGGVMCNACSALPCICVDPDDPCQSKAIKILRAARGQKGVGK